MSTSGQGSGNGLWLLPGEQETTCFIDCNPSFAAYTELALLVANQIIVPCSSDGSSERAIDNLGQLVYGIDVQDAYKAVSSLTEVINLAPGPCYSLFVFNRST